MRTAQRPAFTIVELLVVIGIIATLLAILLPAVSGARDRAKTTTSLSNLKNLATAHQAYAGDWNDRQFTLTVDTISTYGADPIAAISAYKEKGPTGLFPPPIILGWSPDPDGGPKVIQGYFFGTDGAVTSPPLMMPLVLDRAPHGWPWGHYFGWFRLPNVRIFTEYLSGRFYDPVFYAPKDTAVMSMYKQVEDMPGEYTGIAVLGWRNACFSSYCLSPAALFDPGIFRAPDRGGWQDPWEWKDDESIQPAAFRVPSFSQAQYPSLKTHMLEHHWLQNRRRECNPDAPSRLYVYDDDGNPLDFCEPYYFNHSWESAPATLFYDGHIGLVGVADAQRADGRHTQQAGYGLWSRDTPYGDNGYAIDAGYAPTADQLAETSFHILTTDGIKGRDILGE